MITINLFPWREQQRIFYQKLLLLLVFVGTPLLIFGFVYVYLRMVNDL